MIDISFVTNVDTDGEEVTVWVEAVACGTPRGAAYGDENGAFGPPEYDVDIESVSAWRGDENIYGKLDKYARQRIEDDIVAHVVNRICS